MPTTAERVSDVLEHQRVVLSEDVERLRLATTGILASIQCEAAELARVAHEDGVEAVCTRRITECIRDLGAAQAALARQSTKLRDLTSTVDLVRITLVGYDGG